MVSKKAVRCEHANQFAQTTDYDEKGLICLDKNKPRISFTLLFQFGTVFILNEGG